jgi:ubiquinone/menaquinone biosynthesis C-methylase UbiE
MKKYLKRAIPNFIKPILKRIYYFPSDIMYGFKGRDSMIPPKSMIFVGDGDFEKTGQEFKRLFIELAGLQPDSRVLDVGCGIGRMAIPLTGYLSAKGEYWGFDIVKKGIDWCQSRVSPKFSNFHFQHSNVYNKYYNSQGKVLAKDFKFPYEDEFFDFVFLTSVFTHMLPSDLENYMGEISRVLKTEGKCLLTFFILNNESENLVQLGHSTLDFRYEIEGCLTTDRKRPEAAIAYNESHIKMLLQKYGLGIVEPIHYGSWCNRSNYLSYQDIVIATKEHTN